MKLYQNKITFQLDSRLRQFIYISRMNRSLMALLADFFAEGLVRGSLCITILTPRHQRMLNRRLKAKGIDIQAAVKQEQFFILNVKDMFPAIGPADAFDEVEYYKVIEKISARAAAKKQSIRAFGEVIGLRWPRLRFYVPQNE